MPIIEVLFKWLNESTIFHNGSYSLRGGRRRKRADRDWPGRTSAELPESAGVRSSVRLSKKLRTSENVGDAAADAVADAQVR